MKNCGRCGESKPLFAFNKDKYTKSGYRSQCKECMAIERARLREHYKEWRDTEERKAIYASYRRARYQKDKYKIKARNAARKLERKPCEVCGESNSQAHHNDYDKPLNVRWLCSKHHREWHKEHGEAANAS